MGCGASTFNRDEAGGAGGISYLYVNPLHRDSPWRRKGDRPAVDSNPSSKKLLVADEDGGDSVGRKSVSLTPVSSKDNGGFMKEPPVQTMKESNIPLAKEEEVKVVCDDNDRCVIAGECQDRADETSDDKEDVVFFPRSPSFRYYCMPREDDSSSSSSDEMNAQIIEGKSDRVLTRVESSESSKDHDGGEAAPEKLSSSPTSVPPPPPPRKSKKSAARRLRVVLPKGNPATGMKNLLHVTSCSPRRAAQTAST